MASELTCRLVPTARQQIYSSRYNISPAFLASDTPSSARSANDSTSIESGSRSSAKAEYPRLIVARQFDQQGQVPSQEIGDFGGQTVAESNPNHLRRQAAQDAQALEIFVLGDEEIAMCRGKGPYATVLRTFQSFGPQA